MITKNQTYTQAIAAVSAGTGTVFACVNSWPSAFKYIGLNGSDIWVYANPTDPGQPYSPTASDQAAQDWNYGGDRPPR